MPHKPRVRAPKVRASGCQPPLSSTKKKGCQPRKGTLRAQGNRTPVGGQYSLFRDLIFSVFSEK